MRKLCELSGISGVVLAMVKPGQRMKAEVELTCGHKTVLEQPIPSTGDLQYCYGCDDYVPVGSNPKPYVTKCITRRGCYESRSATLNQAESKCFTHNRNKPWHRVQVLKDRLVIGAYESQADGYARRESIPLLNHQKRDSEHSAD